MHTQLSVKNPTFLIPGHILVTGATLQLKCKLTYICTYVHMNAHGSQVGKMWINLQNGLQMGMVPHKCSHILYHLF